MRVKLKQFRVAAGLTQSKAAVAAGVTQPTYQRWEAGTARVPDAKLALLAKLFNTSPEAILSRHKPVESTLYDDDADDALSYYGEVAFHFCGGGKSLLITVSEAAFGSLYRDVQSDKNFFTVRSLANQTVIIRRKAVTDLYFSSEAYDDYGPDHGDYLDHADVQIPDNRDWDIIESLSAGDIGIDDFAAGDVERVRSMVMISDKQYEMLVATGHIKQDELESEKSKNQLQTDRIFDLANNIVYQLSNRARRTLSCYDNKKIFYAFYDLVDYDGGICADDMILFDVEGRHRIVSINKAELDYVIIPSHRFDDGRVEADAEGLDE